jgi:hypothetical protein
MRRLLNFLAVLLVMLGAGIAVANVALIVVAASHAVGVHSILPPEFPVFVVIALGAMLGFIGTLISYRAWTHLRRPDARTARDVLSFGLYMSAFAALSTFLRNYPYLTILAVVGLTLLRHYLSKRLANQFAGVH